MHKGVWRKQKCELCILAVYISTLICSPDCGKNQSTCALPVIDEITAICPDRQNPTSSVTSVEMSSFSLQIHVMVPQREQLNALRTRAELDKNKTNLQYTDNLTLKNN